MATPTATVVGLTTKDKELVAVAASLAAGCIPCTEHHAVAVREAGASEAETQWAAAIGMTVNRRSLSVMGSLAAQRLGLGAGVLPDAPDLVGDEPRLEPLVMVAAAVAAHCVPALEEGMAQAQRAGWTGPDIRRALGVGRMVRETGARKADEAARRLLDAVDDAVTGGG